VNVSTREQISKQGNGRDRQPRLRKKIMPTGTVKFFNATKGYGFIEPEDGGKDAFVHISAVERAGMSTLNEGQKINYELQTGQNGKVSAEDISSAD
jgi:cold shock protein